MNPLEINPQHLHPACPEIDGPKVLQRPDLVWSRMKLEPGEYLLVKVSNHAAPIVNDIKAMIDSVFKREGDRVILFMEGDLTFEKVSFK